MWRRYILPSVFAIGAVASGLVTTVYGTGYDRLPVVGRAAVWSSALCAMLGALLAVFNGVAAAKEKQKSDAYAALLAALAKIVSATGVPANAIGMSAYVVRPETWRPWRLRQVRIARVRLQSAPRCTMTWTLGKGVVGECWRARDRQVTFVRSQSEYLAMTASEWPPPEGNPMGLTFEEWETTKRYALIMAHPVQSHPGDKYVGCVSLDTTRDENVPKLHVEAVWTLLGDAAVAIEKSLVGP